MNLYRVVIKGNPNGVEYLYVVAESMVKAYPEAEQWIADRYKSRALLKLAISVDRIEAVNVPVVIA